MAIKAVLKEQQLDIEIPVRYLEESAEVYKNYDIEKLPLFDRFNRDQSKDYYLGMVAASRAILSGMQQINDKDELEGFVNCVCIHSTIIASKK